MHFDLEGEYNQLTATAAIGESILWIASKPSLDRRNLVWPGSGSTIGNLQKGNSMSASSEFISQSQNYPIDT